MNSHLRWSSHLLRSFYDQGIRHAVISPGSRSTPLTIAAAIHNGFKKTVVIDERSAAFIALGIGKTTGKPAILICTSGTAGVNYMPAVVEARESGVPIIILTADRPPNQRGIGSSQTIDQIKLYGGKEVFFHEAGEPRDSDNDLDRLGYLARQAAEESVRIGGAAHINLPFRKPLEPSADDIEEQISLNQKQVTNLKTSDGKPLRRTLHLSSTAVDLLNKSEKPLIIAGPANPHHALQNIFDTISQQLNAPVIAEPGSSIETGNSLTINRYEQILRVKSFVNEKKPDLVIRFGDQPFTKSLLNAFEYWHKEKVPVLHFSARNASQDQAMSVTEKIVCSPYDQLSADNLEPSDRSSTWLASWKDADQATETILNKAVEGNKGLSDGHVLNVLSEKVPSDWNVMLSNSFIPRDMALFGRPNKHQAVNRGTAGIDGILSTAIGIHSASDRSTLCIMGDIAFLHDSNALLSLRNVDRPFVVAVLNNGGGNIFRMLPVYQHGDYYTQYFETPQNVSFEYLARAHNLNFEVVESLEDLHSLNLQSVEGVQIIECRTDSEISMDMRRKLWDLKYLTESDSDL